MKMKLLLLIAALFSSLQVQSQIDSVIVEKYYISDSGDATDTLGGGLKEGSVTYRIFIDLAEGSKLMRIFGNVNHALRFSSTEDFFNNLDRGKSFGKEISSGKLHENTLALDTWITLGLASISHFGIPKKEDTDGSIIGGIHNDGGSAHIAGGLLVNDDPVAAPSLTSVDGLVPATVLPSNWNIQLNGINLTSSNDSTIFGSLVKGNEFLSNDFYIYNSGTVGTTTDNRILVAQLTTKGNIGFELNLEIEEHNGSIVKLVNYVASDPSGEEKTSRFLTYPTPPPTPKTCGCMDADYIEFRENFECHVQDSCKTIIRFGCTDPLACNYDPNANMNIPDLCCYPGHCNDRDIELICPSLPDKTMDFTLFPNPSHEQVTLKISNGKHMKTQYMVYDSFGTVVLEKCLGIVEDSFVHQINISSLQAGSYLFRITNKDQTLTKVFVKY